MSGGAFSWALRRRYPASVFPDTALPTRPAHPTGDGAPSAPTLFSRWLRRLRGEAPRDAGARPAAHLPASVLDALPDPVVVVDAQDRVLVANQAVGDVLGHEPGALVGTELAEALLPLRSREGYRQRLRQGADGPDSPAEPLAVLRGDGGEVEMALAVRPAADGSLFTVSLREAKTPQATLDASEGRRRTLRTIVDSIPEPVVAVDRVGRVVLRNRAAVRDGSIGPDGPDKVVAAGWWEAASAVMEAGAPVVGREEADPAGGVRLTTRVPVLDRAGAVVGLVVLSRDVTEQKRLEAQLLADKQRAEATARANREFLATTSHEIRTLMNGVTGMTTLLLDTELDGEQREFVDTVRTSSAALLAVINDVLDFSKIEAGMLALEDQPFSIRETVQESLRMFAQQSAAKGLDLASEVAPEVPESVRGDAARVRQVLTNLLSNAVKFTEAGGVRVGVGLAPSEADGPPLLALTVHDTGVGIAPDRLAAVFEQFTQADDSTTRTHGGTGLGLAICRQLVRLMGGEMSAESVPGQGSAFRFTVAVGAEAPAEAASAAPAETASAAGDGRTSPAWVARPAPDRDAAAGPPQMAADVSEPEAAAPARKSGGPRGVVMSADAILPSARLLLAEDNPVNQKVATLTLRRLGYRPDVVANGKQAVMAVRRAPYDVVLMDIMMPVMDGLEATSQIKADPGPHPAPAIVALTANAMEGDRQRCLDAGCDDYLAKPVAPEELAATIERAVRARAAGALAAA